jgi:hypothetical protein
MHRRVYRHGIGIPLRRHQLQSVGIFVCCVCLAMRGMVGQSPGIGVSVVTAGKAPPLVEDTAVVGRPEALSATVAGRSCCFTLVH